MSVSTDRVRRFRAWKEVQNETRLQNGETRLHGRIRISEDKTVTLLTWNPETNVFDETPLQVQDVSKEQQRALYLMQDRAEAAGGRVVATNLVLIADAKNSAILLSWEHDQWVPHRVQDLIHGSRP